MSRDASIAVAVGVSILVLLVAVAVGGLTTTRTTVTQGPVLGQPLPDPPADGASGVVFDQRIAEGMSLLGIRLRADKHYAYIAIAAPEECRGSNDAGEEHLLTEGGCAHLPAHGPVSGGGTTASGVEFVIVELEVSRQCFDTLELGALWPPANDDCPR